MIFLVCGLKSGGTVSGGAALWGSSFLPSEHQGVPFREGADPILHVSILRESIELLSDIPWTC